MTHETKHSRTLTSIGLTKCLECGKGCHNLAVHMLQHVETRNFECDICQATFRSKENLRNHMNIHINARRYKCQQCGRDFNFRSQLSSHLRIHSEMCPFQCETCGKGFKFSGSLKLHRRHHTGEKPFKCDRCEKAFTTAMRLEIHIRIHTGDKPYVCATCGRAFQNESLLKVHLRQHTGESPYACHICGKTTKQVSNLKSHYRHFHKINDITSQMIRAKALLDNRATEEAAKQSQTTKDDSSFFSSHSIEQSAKACKQATIPETHVHKLTSTLIANVSINPKLKDAEITVTDPIEKLKKTKKTAVRKLKPLPISNNDNSIGVCLNPKIEVVKINVNEPIQKAIKTKPTTIKQSNYTQKLPPKEESPNTEKDQKSCPVADHCWNNDTNDCNNDTDSITDAAMVVEVKYGPCSSLSNCTTPGNLKPLMSSSMQEMALQPPPSNLPSTPTLRHPKANENKTHQRCTICPKRFIDYDEHMLRWHTISPAKSYECKECNKMFRTNANLQSHTMLHTEQKNEICKQCDEAFYFATDLRRHMRSHLDVRPFKCEHCGRAFAVNSLYQQHMRIHTGELPYLCHLCGKGTTQAGNLKSHLRHFHKLIVKHVRMEKTT